MSPRIEQLEKIAEGREAEMFAWDDGKILRLAHPRVSEAEVSRQAGLLRTAATSGVRVPQVFDEIELSGRFGIVMERLDGLDLLTEAGNHPWRVFSLAATCGRVHAALNAVKAPDTLPDWKVYAARRIEMGDVPPRYASLALERISQLPSGDRLCHGDFHPANVMTNAGEPVVIDWTNASRGLAEADFVHSSLILSYGEPPPGTSRVTRLAANVGRSAFRWQYGRSYRGSSNLDAELEAKCLLPVAVARLAENIPGERGQLVGLIEKNLLPK